MPKLDFNTLKKRSTTLIVWCVNYDIRLVEHKSFSKISNYMFQSNQTLNGLIKEHEPMFTTPKEALEYIKDKLEEDLEKINTALDGDHILW